MVLKPVERKRERERGRASVCECLENRKKVLQEEEIRERVFDKETREKGSKEKRRSRQRNLACNNIRKIVSGGSFV